MDIPVGNSIESLGFIFLDPLFGGGLGITIEMNRRRRRLYIVAPTGWDNVTAPGLQIHFVPDLDRCEGSFSGSSTTEGRTVTRSFPPFPSRTVI